MTFFYFTFEEIQLSTEPHPEPALGKPLTSLVPSKFILPLWPRLSKGSGTSVQISYNLLIYLRSLEQSSRENFENFTMG